MLMEFKGHKSYIRSFEISNDLRLVMSCDEGGTICIWEKSTGKEVWKNKFQNGIRRSEKLQDNQSVVLTDTGGNIHFLKF